MSLAKLGMFQYFDEVDPRRGERFALGMAGSELIRPLTEEVYPFDQLPEGAQVVDVGGGRGQVSIRIAEKVPHLSFVVQDQASVVESVQAEGGLEELDDRVQFQPHNFFVAQPVKGADVYLFRFVLHDHPDRQVFQLLIEFKALELPQRLWFFIISSLYICTFFTLTTSWNRTVPASLFSVKSSKPWIPQNHAS